MPTELYLDTARFGQTGVRAQEALRDFVRLSGEEGGSQLLVDFVRYGAGGFGERYPGLAAWRGVPEFKRSLRSVAGFAPETDVLVAARSSQLMRLAALALFRRCGRVLHTDLEWPGYLAILRAEGDRVSREVVCVPVRDDVFSGALTRDGLVRKLADSFRATDCEGVFLSDVSYDGIRLPVAELLEELRFSRRLRFVAIDGAQALGHIRPTVQDVPCDLYLAGCHKWLSAGQPLGLGFCPRASSRGFLRAALAEMIANGAVDDPLLLVDRELEVGAGEPFGETADLTSLFSAAAAVDAEKSLLKHDDALADRLANAETARAAAVGTGWRALPVDPPLRSGIVLLQAERGRLKAVSPGETRDKFQRQGIALTTYEAGRVRVSAPRLSWQDGDLGKLRSALARCS
jgi:hypothetical protein